MPDREREEYTMYPLGPRKSLVSFFLCPQSLSIVELNSLFIILHLHTIVELLEVRGLIVWFLIVHIHSPVLPTSHKQWIAELGLESICASRHFLSPINPIPGSYFILSHHVSDELKMRLFRASSSFFFFCCLFFYYFYFSLW